MSITTHVSVSVQGLLDRRDDELAEEMGSFTNNGIAFLDVKAFREAMTHLHNLGVRFLPIGEPCEGFSPESGCPGHDNKDASIPHGITLTKFTLPLCVHATDRLFLALPTNEEVCSKGVRLGWYDHLDVYEFYLNEAVWGKMPYSTHKGELWFRKKHDDLKVCVDYSTKPGGEAWVHVSLSRPRHTPCYGDMCDVKKAFFGDERWSIQYFPEETKHVNIHPFCLHLWHRPNGDVCPDFTRGLGMI